MEIGATRWMPWLSAIGGIWLVIAPFVGGLDLSIHWVSILLGIAAIVLSAAVYYGMAARNTTLFWLSWINVAIGLAAAAYPFLYSITDNTMLTLYLLAGALIFVVSLIHAIGTTIMERSA